MTENLHPRDRVLPPDASDPSFSELVPVEALAMAGFEIGHQWE